MTHRLPEQCGRRHAVLPTQHARVCGRRQVFDVPTIAFHVAEHHALALTCACGQLHVSSLPSGVSESVQYGPNVRAPGVHLTQGQMLPHARAAGLIHDVYGLAVSPGTLVAWVAEASAALQETANVIASQLNAAQLVHANASGLRVAGKLHWRRPKSTAFSPGAPAYSCTIAEPHIATAPSISASSAPASIRCVNKATTCLPCYKAPSPALLSKQPYSG